MISSYSSLTFINSSKYIAARDFLTVKVWDITKTDKPILCIPEQDSLKSKALASDVIKNPLKSKKAIKRMLMVDLLS